jgi:hypothetical protein
MYLFSFSFHSAALFALRLLSPLNFSKDCVSLGLSIICFLSILAMEFMGIDPTSTSVYLLYSYDWQMMSVLPHYRDKIKWFA